MGNAPTGESIDARAVNVDRLADGEIVARSRQENRPVVDPQPDRVSVLEAVGFCPSLPAARSGTPERVLMASRSSSRVEPRLGTSQPRFLGVACVGRRPALAR